MVSGVAIILIIGGILFLQKLVTSCPETSGGPTLADVVADIAVQRAGIELLTNKKNELEQDIAMRRVAMQAAKKKPEKKSEADGRVAFLEERLKMLEKKLTASTQTKAPAAVVVEEEVPAVTVVAEETSAEVVIDPPAASQTAPTVERPIPKPPTREQVMKRIKQTPECIAAVEKGFFKNNFNSQFSQDWFVYMNYLHHLDEGFYVDLGASSWKENSNTWFFDQCLGWKGLCIEADADLAANLRKKRTCTVVHACVSSKAGPMALQAAGIQIGHIVAVSEKTDKGVITQCRTMREILDTHRVRHVDFMSMDIEDSEPAALVTFPDVPEEISIDVILVENEKGDLNRPPCYRSNLLRFPFFNREYTLVNVLGDDIWVKLTSPRMWRLEMVYPRLNPEREKKMRSQYKYNPVYTQPMIDKLLKNPAEKAY